MAAGSSQIFGANGQTTNAFLRRRVDGVAQRGGDDRQTRFADSSGFFFAHDDVDFGFRSLAHARHFVVVKIGLFDTATLDGDGVMQRCRKAIDSCAFDLSANAFRIDGTAAIHGIDDVPDFYRASIHAGFDDGCGVTLEGIVTGDAAKNALGKRLAPIGLFRGETQYSLEARGVERLAFFRVGEVRDFAVSTDEAEAEFQRVDARRVSEFVHERLDDEAAGGMLDGSPPGARHGRLCERVLNAVIWRLIRNERRGGKFGFFRGLFSLGIPHRLDGGGGLEMLPRGKIALGIESAGKMVIRGRTIETVLHVVLTSPQDHYGFAGGFGNLRCFHDEVRLIAPAEAAAHQRGVHNHFLRRQSRYFRDDFLRPLRGLSGNPRFRAVGTDVHGAIHRLHGSVTGKGKFVGGFDLFRGSGERRIRVTVVADDFTGLGSIIQKLLAQRIRGFRGGGTFVPSDLQRFAALDGGPGIVGEHDNSTGREGARADGIDGDNVLNSRNCFAFCSVKGFQLAAKYGAAGNDCELHAGHARINAELRRAGGLIPRFKAPRVVPDDRKSVRILERDRFEIWDGQLGRILNEFAVGQKILARPVEHAAVFRHAGIGIYVPARRGGGDQHFTRSRSSLAHGQPGARDAAAAARAVVINVGIGRRLFNVYVLPIEIEFFRENHGQGGHDALAHLGLAEN